VRAFEDELNELRDKLSGDLQTSLERLVSHVCLSGTYSWGHLPIREKCRVSARCLSV